MIWNNTVNTVQLNFNFNFICMAMHGNITQQDIWLHGPRFLIVWVYTSHVIYHSPCIYHTWNSHTVQERRKQGAVVWNDIANSCLVTLIRILPACWNSTKVEIKFVYILASTFQNAVSCFLTFCCSNRSLLLFRITAVNIRYSKS